MCLFFWFAFCFLSILVWNKGSTKHHLLTPTPPWNPPQPNKQEAKQSDPRPWSSMPWGKTVCIDKSVVCFKLFFDLIFWKIMYPFKFILYHVSLHFQEDYLTWGLSQTVTTNGHNVGFRHWLAVAHATPEGWPDCPTCSREMRQQEGYCPLPWFVVERSVQV